MCYYLPGGLELLSLECEGEEADRETEKQTQTSYKQVAVFSQLNFKAN